MIALLRRATVIGVPVFTTVLLFSAGVSKLNDPLALAFDLEGYELGGPLLAMAVASVVPALELFLAFCLLLNVRARLALAATAALMLVFLVAQVSVVARGLTTDCGCSLPFPGEEGSSTVGFTTIARTAVFTFIALGGVALLPRHAAHGEAP